MSEDRLTTGFAGPEDSPGFLLWRVTNRWQAAQRASLRPHGLTHVQFVLLATLAWQAADGPVTQRALASAAATDEMMTSQVLRTLEERDLLRRTPPPGDRRARALEITPAGRALANAAVADVDACDRAFFAPLGVSAPTFTAELRRLADLT